MSQYKKWMRTTLIILLLEIIVLTSFINYHFLSKSSITTVYIAQAQVVGESVPADSHSTIEQSKPKNSTSDENGLTASNPNIALIIKKHFGKDAEIMEQIAEWESTNNPKAQNWNCIYNGKSTSCRAEDREKAWSVDCGYLQINVRAKTCPKELFDVETNIKVAKGILDKQGFTAWSSYKFSNLNK